MTITRPGRRSDVISFAGCSTLVGFVGLPIMTRSAVAGTWSAASRKPVVGDKTSRSGGGRPQPAQPPAR
jgi:hypothetical protein